MIKNILAKVPDKLNGTPDWSCLLIETWQSNSTRLPEHYPKSSTVNWSDPLQKHLKEQYKGNGRPVK